MQDEFPAARPWGPCQNLYAAVLVSAFNTYRAGGIRGRDRQAAYLWFAGFGSYATVPVPFADCCGVLGLDPSAVRRTLIEPAPVLVLVKERRKGGGWLYGPRTPRHGGTPRTRALRHPHRMGRARHAS